MNNSVNIHFPTVENHLQCGGTLSDICDEFLITIDELERQINIEFNGLSLDAFERRNAAIGRRHILTSIYNAMYSTNFRRIYIPEFIEARLGLVGSDRSSDDVQKRLLDILDS